MGNPFDATASMLGYLFQCRLALVDALRRLRYQGSFTVSLETLEDIVFEKEGQPTELLQTKHHVSRAASVSDASADLWKTIRVWAEGFSQNRWEADTIHYLATTETASSSSLAYLLRQRSRDEVRARDRLDQVARTSENVDNRVCYDAYLKLSGDERLSLVQRIVILDRTPTIEALDTLLRQELTTTVRREQLDAFITRLEGWWLQRVILHLRRTPPDDAIRSEELDVYIDLLRDQFGPENLPIDPDLLDAQIDEAAFANHVFVAQLQLLGVAGKRVVNAMRQFYRASEQRSRWLREGILRFGELQAYDRRLCEEWDIRFNQMLDDLGQEVAEPKMVEAARILYKWAEQDAAFLIRVACNEPFICRGSLQMLSDTRNVGWHPQFIERLKHIVSEAS
jgi:hypothetical protein